MEMKYVLQTLLFFSADMADHILQAFMQIYPQGEK